MLKSLLTPYAWNSAPALNGAIQKTLSAALESKYYPALSAGVVRLIKPNSSQESFSLEFGHAACGVLQADPPPNTSKQLVSVSDKFHLGSCGKAMTALMMHDVISSDPDISWNSTIGDFMPNVNSHWKDISLLDLMSHQAGVDDNTMLNGLRSSGIGKYADILSAVNGQLFKGTHDMIFKLWKPYLDEESSLKELDPAERVKITRHQRIKSKVEQYQPNPRGKYSYSNLGVSIAANMIELHTGQPFEVLMKEKFADPLGLQSFGFGAPGKTQENQPLGHCNDSFFGVNNRSFSPYEDPVPEIIQAAGNMHLNMSDWLRTLSANLILGRTLSTMPPMYCQQVPVSKFGKGVGYGAGWITQNTASNKTVQSKANHIEELCISDKPEHQMKIIHDGSNAQWMAICFVDFSLGIASALVTNTSHARILLQFSKVLQNITLNALETEVTKNKSNPE